MQQMQEYFGKTALPKIKKGRGALGDETRIATNTYAQAVAKINNTIIPTDITPDKIKRFVLKSSFFL